MGASQRTGVQIHTPPPSLTGRFTRLAAIDVGSNALRLTIIGVDPTAAAGAPPAWHEVVRERSALRLGHDVFAKGRLTDETILTACDALARFRRMMDNAEVDAYHAVATSAVREAANGSALVSRVRRRTGIELDVIGGVQEARLVARAVQQRVAVGPGPAVLIDLGGGSAEISVLGPGKAFRTTSLPLGAIRLLESGLIERHDGMNLRQRGALDRHIDRVLRPVLTAIPGRIAHLIVTGGNARAIARLCPSVSAIGHCIDVAQMRALLHTLAPLSPAARRLARSLSTDRADVIVPAAAVLLGIATRLGCASIAAPDVALSDGVLDALVADSRLNVSAAHAVA
jgi:exopolyphosphatase / guanosine-5'-triphosphate,3'-diphosphate pyrophosphatase